MSIHTCTMTSVRRDFFPRRLWPCGPGAPAVFTSHGVPSGARTSAMQTNGSLTCPGISQRSVHLMRGSVTAWRRGDDEHAPPFTPLAPPAPTPQLSVGGRAGMRRKPPPVAAPSRQKPRWRPASAPPREMPAPSVRAARAGPAPRIGPSPPRPPTFAAWRAPGRAGGVRAVTAAPAAAPAAS
eukprot:scaffold7923_cov121-Isochrysis_galbana.AAC.13